MQYKDRDFVIKHLIFDIKITLESSDVCELTEEFITLKNLGINRKD